jgi:homoserine dehydrogenase
MRVALAGYGVVGAGVYARLARAPRRFEVAAVLCRDPARRAAEGGPARLLTDDAARLVGCDLLIEAVGGIDLAETIVLRALRAGADVVTANKSLMSRRYEAVAAASGAGGGRIRYSAAVGGGVPMLEALARIGTDDPVERVAAVLNGTTNFVLDRIAEGAGLADAIHEARIAGFAEADPTHDIDGVDAAEKLALIARAAFGISVSPDEIPRTPLSSVAPGAIAGARAAGREIKQIAAARHESNRVIFDVSFRECAAADALARPRREENCLVIERRSGRRLVMQGKGAGRDPTADAILADVRFFVNAGPVS